jgi:hypothetical protein
MVNVIAWPLGAKREEDEYVNVTPSKKTSYEPNQFTSSSLPPPSSHSVPSLPMPQAPSQGKCISQDIALLNKLGWKNFVDARRPCKDLANMHLSHPTRRLLLNYHDRGVPAKVTTPPWSPECI